MELSELLIDIFQRVSEHVDEAVAGLDAETLITAPEQGANPIGWLVWHLTRVQDHHVAELVGEEQIWVSGGWASHFGVDPDPENTGYGHSWADVMTIRPASAAALTDYYAAVAVRTRAMLERTTAADLDRIVDDRWDPPVTLGVRLVSVADDDIQHAAQATYVRGLLERR